MSKSSDPPTICELFAGLKPQMKKQIIEIICRKNNYENLSSEEMCNELIIEINDALRVHKKLSETNLAQNASESFINNIKLLEQSEIDKYHKHKEKTELKPKKFQNIPEENRTNNLDN